VGDGSRGSSGRGNIIDTTAIVTQAAIRSKNDFWPDLCAPRDGGRLVNPGSIEKKWPPPDERYGRADDGA
jgi:hypothetical protein